MWNLVEISLVWVQISVGTGSFMCKIGPVYVWLRFTRYKRPADIPLTLKLPF